MTEIDVELGPIDYLVVEYPDGQPTGEALPYLLELVDSGMIRILDMAVLAKDAEGNVAAVAVGPDDDDAFAVFAGAASGLLSDEDIVAIGDVLTPGAVGTVLVYENSWAAPFGNALRKAGAQLVANGRIPINALLAALDVDSEGKI